ncbi:MAG: hypothetical protein U5K84_00085 [Alkalibacterium sp.]|nr:hypothetical protein [Alkalibacterium sp.]
MTEDELKEMEEIVNQKIQENIAVETLETDIDTAKDMGAMALFGRGVRGKCPRGNDW